MKKIIFFSMLLMSYHVSSETLNLVCKLDKGDGRPVPFTFIKNPNGLTQMFRFDKNETRTIKYENEPPSKSLLVSLEITNSEIRYQTKLEGYVHTSLDMNSPLVEQGETRTGTISKIDGSWNEYYSSYGPWTEIFGKYNNQYGKCITRTENKIK